MTQTRGSDADPPAASLPRLGVGAALILAVRALVLGLLDDAWRALLTIADDLRVSWGLG